MKLNIKNRADAMKAIDAFGDNQDRIDELLETNRKLKALFEEWALANPDEAFSGDTLEDATERYTYALVKAAPALKVQSHLTREEVVAKMRDDETMAEYVIADFDAAAIKADFARKPRQVEDFGLYFTDPKPHLHVTAKA